MITKCPACEAEAKGEAAWTCSACEAAYDAMAAQACCPGCAWVRPETECPACGAASDHATWLATAERQAAFRARVQRLVEQAREDERDLLGLRRALFVHDLTLETQRGWRAVWRERLLGALEQGRALEAAELCAKLRWLDDRLREAEAERAATHRACEAAGWAAAQEAEAAGPPAGSPVAARLDALGLPPDLSASVERISSSARGVLGELWERLTGDWTGSEQLLAGDWEGAVRACTRGLADGGEQPELRRNRGLARWKLGDLEGALEDFTAAHRARPDAYDAEQVARLRWHLGDVHGVVEAATEAIALDPSRSMAHAMRGEVLRGMGQPERARHDLLDAARLEPDPWRLSRLAAAHYDLGDYAAALDAAESALALDPDSSGAVLQRAYALWALERRGEAVAAAAASLRLDPLDAEARHVRSLCRMVEGRLEEALRDEEAQVGQAEATSWVFRGLLRHLLGDAAGAQADLLHAVESEERWRAEWAEAGVEHPLNPWANIWLALVTGDDTALPDPEGADGFDQACLRYLTGKLDPVSLLETADLPGDGRLRARQRCTAHVLMALRAGDADEREAQLEAARALGLQPSQTSIYAHAAAGAKARSAPEPEVEPDWSAELLEGIERLADLRQRQVLDGAELAKAARRLVEQHTGAQ